ncbi:hypothetical protein B0J18DRAFT_423137 [Chaetomium sp. MPI-SDFR-AT-0129]|nr:hypothetical protein B0J18DRAFT_423137 [Chaetomium sp. MPI-SDFR-AT-0129]
MGTPNGFLSSSDHERLLDGNANGNLDAKTDVENNNQKNNNDNNTDDADADADKEPLFTFDSDLSDDDDDATPAAAAAAAAADPVINLDELAKSSLAALGQRALIAAGSLVKAGGDSSDSTGTGSGSGSTTGNGTGGGLSPALREGWASAVARVADIADMGDSEDGLFVEQDDDMKAVETVEVVSDVGAQAAQQEQPAQRQAQQHAWEADEIPDEFSDDQPDEKQKPVKFVDIEVRLPWLSPEERAGYEKIEVGEYWPEEEYMRRRKRGRRDDEDYADQFGTKKRKRDLDYTSYDEYSEDSDGDIVMEDAGPSRRRSGLIDDYLDGPNGRRSTRASTRASSHLVSDEGDNDDSSRPRPRGLRLRARASVVRNRPADYDDRDELQDSDGEDPSFSIIQSDIVQTRKRGRQKRSAAAAAQARTRRMGYAGGDSDIEFESNDNKRRSSRPNKTKRVMTDTYMDDDDEDDFVFYRDDDKPSTTTPKVASIREIFQPVTYDFKEAHRPICESCGGHGDSSNKGPLVHCQGCSNSYHKYCLGPRGTREHRVTKVGADSFVLQCRFCIGIYKKKDPRAPNHDVCQGCHTKNPSCAAFSEKKTPKQEEALRADNDGVDPITPVEPKLVNGADNTLFRCSRCRRPWHYEHLPHPNLSRDPALDEPLALRKLRREEYQITWTCKECRDTEEEKADRIVAWRPVDSSQKSRDRAVGMSVTDFVEDELEYLVKWDKKSYGHCVWLPGAWVYGVVKPAMRVSFIKRTFGEGSDEGVTDENGEEQNRHVDSLLRWTTEEAVHESWVTADIILDVHCAPRTKENDKKHRAKPLRERFEDDLSRIHHVLKIFVKFEGLGYEDAVWDSPPSPDAGAMYDAFCAAYREYLNGKHFETEPARVMKERVESFRQLDFRKDIEVKTQPAGLQRGKLMAYQMDGLNWMLYNYRDDRSIILADEMGLGKTVQVVALLSSMIQDCPKVWPFLVVVPNATCSNWRREIKKWAPDLRVVAYYGGRVSQTLAMEYELFPGRCRDMKAHVVIMSYDSVKDSDTRARFSSTKWAGLVVDEAQALKNDENALYRALSTLRIPWKLLLTGTPLQNNKRELFNLLQFINPSLIRAEDLDAQFAQITSENLPALHRLIRPYFLRRTKAEVLTFLPPMAQIILPVTMSVLQERLCKSILARNPELIRSVFVQAASRDENGTGASKRKVVEQRGSLNNILMQLRKCLCHPFIYSQAIEDRSDSISAERTRRNLIEASSKLVLLEQMLPKLHARGHRVLLFSQFLDELTILEDFLAGLGLRHERLDGSQSSLEKQKKIDAFNAPSSPIFAMLLSTRAGGVGINLATADTVIILDPDWNPHQDIQALSRAHRIGQQKKVLCFQLMTVDSAEEKILQIGRKKLALDHLLIETMDSEEEAPSEVESILRHGAAALFGEGKRKDAIHYDAAAVDKLLDRSTMENPPPKTSSSSASSSDDDGDDKEGKAKDKSAESAFAFARVWAVDGDDGDGAGDGLDDEKEATMDVGVWDRILEQRAAEARREAEARKETLGRGGRRRGAANYIGPRFEFDDAAQPDSDQGDADDDFVGSGGEHGGDEDDDESENSGDEDEGTGELMLDGVEGMAKDSDRTREDAHTKTKSAKDNDRRNRDDRDGNRETGSATGRGTPRGGRTASAGGQPNGQSPGPGAGQGTGAGRSGPNSRRGTSTGAGAGPGKGTGTGTEKGGDATRKGQRKPGSDDTVRAGNGLTPSAPSSSLPPSVPPMYSTSPIPVPQIPGPHGRAAPVLGSTYFRMPEGGTGTNTGAKAGAADRSTPDLGPLSGISEAAARLQAMASARLCAKYGEDLYGKAGPLTNGHLPNGHLTNGISTASASTPTPITPTTAAKMTPTTTPTTPKMVPKAAPTPATGTGTGTNTRTAATGQVPTKKGGKPTLPTDPCLVCMFVHPEAWECPEMRSEVRLRLALDLLRRSASATGGRSGKGGTLGEMGKAEMERKRAFLGGELRGLILERERRMKKGGG